MDASNISVFFPEPYKSVRNVISQISFGAVCGWASGCALRKGGNFVGPLLGGGYIAVQSLSYAGYAKIDWPRLKTDYKSFIEDDGTDKLSLERINGSLTTVSDYLQGNIPMSSSFAGSFVYGLSGSFKFAVLGTMGYCGLINTVLGMTPGEIFGLPAKFVVSTDDFEPMMNAGVKMFTTSSDFSKRTALEDELGNCSIEDLRIIEMEAKKDCDTFAKTIGLQTDFLEKDELLRLIEFTKKIVKGNP